MFILVIFLPRVFFQSMAYFSAKIIFTLLEVLAYVRENIRPGQVIILIQVKPKKYLSYLR